MTSPLSGFTARPLFTIFYFLTLVAADSIFGGDTFGGDTSAFGGDTSCGLLIYKN